MRVNKTGGVTPRDRRLDRRKVAIAAVAALFLFAAAPAKAGIVEFLVDPNVSSMTVAQDIDLSQLFGNPFGTNVFSTSPQVPGSDTAGLFGNLYADLGAGASIQFLGLGTVTVANTDGGAGYQPFDPVVSDPGPGIPAPFGVTTPANYGLTMGAPLNLFQVEHGLIGTVVGPARPVVGTSFAFVPGADFYLGTGGRIAFVSALGNDTDDTVGTPYAVMGTAGVTPGTWDPADNTAGPLGTLTIPLESAFTITLTAEVQPGVFIDIPVAFFASGQIVATPQIPEPSTMVLLGFGAVGLVVCGLRLRKRRS